MFVTFLTISDSQMAAWQRGIGNGLPLDKLLPSSREHLQIAPELNMILPTNVPEGKSVPLFNENVEIETFNTTEDDKEDARFAAARHGFSINQKWPSRHLRGMKSIFSIQSGVIYVNIVSHKMSEHLIL
jgi:hypothetical protein